MTKWYFPSRQSLKFAKAKKDIKAGADPAKLAAAMDLLTEQQQKVTDRKAELTRLHRRQEKLLDLNTEIMRKINNGFYQTGNEKARAMADIKQNQDNIYRLESQDIAQVKGEYDREMDDLTSAIQIIEDNFMV